MQRYVGIYRPTPLQLSGLEREVARRDYSILSFPPSVNIFNSDIWQYFDGVNPAIVVWYNSGSVGSH
jgi:hypothetical protein